MVMYTKIYFEITFKLTVSNQFRLCCVCVLKQRIAAALETNSQQTGTYRDRDPQTIRPNNRLSLLHIFLFASSGHHSKPNQQIYFFYLFGL